MTDIDHKELFFKPGVSPTSINDFFECPAKFWRYSSLNPEKEKRETTAAMLFGRLVHCLVLTPEMFEQDFAIEPVKTTELETIDDMKAVLAQHNVSLKSSAKKSDYIVAVSQVAPQAKFWGVELETFKQKAGRRTIVTKEQFDLARSMQDAMFRNPAVKNLIGNGYSEEPYCWFPDGPHGIMRKCKLDYMRQGLIIEYKTAEDPDPLRFEREIGERGYHRQLAMQIDACTRRYNEAPRGAVIIAQDKEYHDDISIVAVNAPALTIGAEEVEYAFQQIAERRKTGNWKKFPEKIQPIGLPRYYQPKHVQRA